MIIYYNYYNRPSALQNFAALLVQTFVHSYWRGLCIQERHQGLFRSHISNTLQSHAQCTALVFPVCSDLAYGRHSMSAIGWQPEILRRLWLVRIQKDAWSVNDMNMTWTKVCTFLHFLPSFVAVSVNSVQHFGTSATVTSVAVIPWREAG